MLRVQCGEVSERSKELAWKVSEGVKLLHGFKSHPLRHFLCFLVFLIFLECNIQLEAIIESMCFAYI